MGMLRLLISFFRRGVESLEKRGVVNNVDRIGVAGSLIGGLRMAGFPPTPGFFIKVRVISVSISSLWGVPLTLLVMSSVYFLNLYISVLNKIFFEQIKSLPYTSSVGGA